MQCNTTAMAMALTVKVNSESEQKSNKQIPVLFGLSGRPYFKFSPAHHSRFLNFTSSALLLDRLRNQNYRQFKKKTEVRQIQDCSDV